MKIKIMIRNLWYMATYRFVRPKIVVTGAKFSGDGIFIDIRYWLSRPDKINPKAVPYLVSVRNQKIELMYFSKFGIIKTNKKKHTNTGILLFYNKNNSVKKGESVTLYWDGLEYKDIGVR